LIFYARKLQIKLNKHYKTVFNAYAYRYILLPDFEGYRNNAKKKFEENQNYIGDEKFHQEPDHPSTFMKMVKERIRKISAVNDERR
jgi:hypothetical protein